MPCLSVRRKITTGRRIHNVPKPLHPISGVYIGGADGPWLPPWRQLRGKKICGNTNDFLVFSSTMEMAKFKDFVIVFEFLVIGNRDVMQYFLLQPFLRNALIFCNDLHVSYGV